MNRMWEIKNQTEKALDLYIYGTVESDHRDWWTDEIIKSETSANALRDKLAEAGDIDEINIYINSEGGSVMEGTAIYSQLRRHKAKKIVHIDGFACSIASLIAMAGDEIIIAPNALMMIHNAWTYAVGNSRELRKAADDLDKINSAQRSAYLLKSGDKLSENKLIELMDAESWLNAEDCIKYGLADQIGEEAVDMTEANEKMQKAIDGLQSRMSFCKSLAAQLRTLSEPSAAKAPEPEPPKSEPAEPEPQKDEPNALIKALAGIK